MKEELEVIWNVIVKHGVSIHKTDEDTHVYSYTGVLDRQQIEKAITKALEAAKQEGRESKYMLVGGRQLGKTHTIETFKEGFHAGLNEAAGRLMDEFSLATTLTEAVVRINKEYEAIQAEIKE